MVVWGTSFGSHDAALAVFDTYENKILFASHSERFSKIKDDANLSPALIQYALDNYGSPSKIFYYENPWVKKLRYVRSGQFSNIFEPLPKKTFDQFELNCDIQYTDHHLSHAAAGYYTSKFSNAAIVVIDAIGEFTTLSIWEAEGSSLKLRKKWSYPDSLGLFYSAMTSVAKLKPNGEEYIFMGMAAYGNPATYQSVIKNTFFNDLDNHNFILKYNLHKGVKFDLNDNDVYDFAASVQSVYEEYFKKVLDWAWLNISSSNLVVMGGCALNCVANSKIKDWHKWNNVWIMPNPGDAGSAIGAILAHQKTHINWESPYLGYNINSSYPTDQLLNELQQNQIAAVANGKAEFGPRALGNRSIFADPRVPDIKQRMNWLKKREQFRPFAAVIPEELAPQYFDMKSIKNSPYMQYVFECKDPALYPGIAHVDSTSRIQTVKHAQHPGLYTLLMKWYSTTKCPMLINTSLNIKNQPLVNDETDAKKFQDMYQILVF